MLTPWRATSSSPSQGEGEQSGATALGPDSPISHALCVREAIASSNYHNFFELYRSCPNLGKLILDAFYDKMRVLALLRIVKAYRPTIEVDFVLQELDFKGDQEAGFEFLSSCGVVLNDSRTEVDSRKSCIKAEGIADETSTF